MGSSGWEVASPMELLAYLIYLRQMGNMEVDPAVPVETMGLYACPFLGQMADAEKKECTHKRWDQKLTQGHQ